MDIVFWLNQEDNIAWSNIDHKEEEKDENERDYYKADSR